MLRSSGRCQYVYTARRLYNMSREGYEAGSIRTDSLFRGLCPLSMETPTTWAPVEANKKPRTTLPAQLKQVTRNRGDRWNFCTQKEF